ncbi:MAG: preprotein translocase subunit SecG [Planctomycetota bacterium]
MNTLIVLCSIVYVIASMFLCFVVLIQKGEGGGLGGAFGGGAVDTAFGAKADTTWKKATAVAATLFLVLAMFLGVMQNHQKGRSATALNPNAPGVSPPQDGEGEGSSDEGSSEGGSSEGAGDGSSEAPKDE